MSLRLPNFELSTVLLMADLSYILKANEKRKKCLSTDIQIIASA